MKKESDPINYCTFCEKFSNSSSAKKKWFDQELYSMKDFVVIPGIGPFIEGYLLILPRKHRISVSQFTKKEIENFSNFKDEIAQKLTQKYGPVIIFEHGPANPSNNAGSCIDHAHLHIHAMPINIFPKLNSLVQFTKIKNYMQIQTFNKRSYLYFEDRNKNMYIAQVDNLPSQFFRRLIAEAMGKDEQWDYALFPNFDLVQSMILKMESWSSKP